MAVSKNKPYVFFFVAILLVSFFMFAVQWHRRLTPRLLVPANKGIASLFTADGRLTAVFQDGRVCIWDWDVPEIRQSDFMAGSGRAIPLGQGQLAVLGHAADRRLVSVYELASGKKVKDMSVGWEDQDIHLRNSHEMVTPLLVRRNIEGSSAVEYEFAAIDIAADLLRPPVIVKLDSRTQTLRDFAVSQAGIVYAAGGDNGQARLVALELNSGQTLWDKTWTDAAELTTVAISYDGQTVWVGDRGGMLLTVAARDGEQLGKMSLLRPGETRQITNDFSVLNLVLSPDERRLACTIAPITCVVEAATGVVTHRLTGHKVVSKVAFSPDSRKLATSDLRADGAILIRNLD